MWSSCGLNVFSTQMREVIKQSETCALAHSFGRRQSSRAGRVVSSTLTIYLYRHPDTFQLNANYDVYITLLDFSSFCGRVHDAVGCCCY